MKLENLAQEQCLPLHPKKIGLYGLAHFQPAERWSRLKTIQIVVVFYYDSKSFSYVNVSGTARLVNDPDLKAKYWKEGWKRFYPDREKDYILVEVTPERMEVCSFKYNLLWDQDGIPPSVEFDTGGSR